MATTLSLVTLLVAQAATFTSLATFFKPFTPPPGVTHSWKDGRRRSRQIKGAEPYTAAEVPLLRSVAHWTLTLRPPVLSVVGVLLVSVGIALAPPELGLGSTGAGLILTRSMQILGFVLFACLSIALLLAPAQRRACEQFLRQTGPSI